MMKLAEVLRKTRTLETRGDLNIEISHIRYDSRLVEKGDCFVAISGFKADGIRYLPQALARGAVAVVTETPLSDEDIPVTWIQVPDARRALSSMAAVMYEEGIRNLTLIGVTGTNGKTTVSCLLGHILARVAPTGVVGTMGMSCFGGPGPEYRVDTGLTTPESVDTFEFAAYLKEAGARYLVMEASSAAITLKRVADIPFNLAIFTTFSGDHLDFHGTMENYFQAKLSLFQRLAQRDWAVINTDDPVAEKIIPDLECRYLTYGFGKNADIFPESFKLTVQGIYARLQTPLGHVSIKSSLKGRVNLLNIMAAVGASQILKIPEKEIKTAIAELKAVRGRLEFVYSGKFSVLVDYAHTDDALQALLKSIRELCSGKIVLVFGAGGDRDHSKRPRMGKVAAELADKIIITNDNPRSEDPNKIVEDIRTGFPAGFSDFIIQTDRRQAIEHALADADAGDMVVIAGKGHENYQITGESRIHFDDAEIIADWLRKQGLIREGGNG